MQVAYICPGGAEAVSFLCPRVPEPLCGCTVGCNPDKLAAVGAESSSYWEWGYTWGWTRRPVASPSAGVPRPVLGLGVTAASKAGVLCAVEESRAE